MPGRRGVLALGSRRGARASRLCLWLVLLPGLLSAACGAQPEERTDSATGGSSEMVAPATVPEGAAAEESSEAGTRETSGSIPENQELDARLISAAERGGTGAVERLLDEGASVRARDANGRTALVAAAYGNHLGAAEVLVRAGADVNAKDGTEQSAYLISTSEVGDDPRLLGLTLENGADVGSLDSYSGTGLIRAADRGHVRIVEKLLETETDVDHVNELGWTALLETIILGEGDARHTEIVRLLVEGGADPNLPDGEGVTPLEHAEQRGYSEMAEILRSAGAR